MFNPERILGSLVKDGLGIGFGKKIGHGGMGGGLGMGSKAAIGLGLLGVAMEAIEHFSSQQQNARQADVPPVPPRAGSMAPPPLPAASSAPGLSVPPPPPAGMPQAGGQVPPPPPGAAPDPGREASDAVLLIRSMIAAAYADGLLDDSERANIMQRLSSLSVEEQQFMTKELSEPVDVDRIIAAVDTPALAQKVYIASLLAIVPDTEAEYSYLRTLAKRLYLNDAMLERIHREMGIDMP